MQPKKSDKNVCNTSNTCLNSLGYSEPQKKTAKKNGYSIEAKVFHIIEDATEVLKPCEIARKIHIDRLPKEITQGEYTTVRVACAKLLQKGLVVQPYPSYYCNKITHGVRYEPLCVHNVTLLARVCHNIVHWVVDELVGGVKLHVCFGEERKQISGYIACDVGGMSHDACLLALHRWLEIVEGRLGYCLQDLIVQTVEFNKDFHGMRFDGMQCITRCDLDGMIDRLYQKDEDVIRHERKITTPMSVNRFEAEMHKGLEQIGKAQVEYELRREVKRNSDALKFTNSRLLGMEKILEAMYKHLTFEAGGVRSVDRLSREGDYSR